MCGLAAILRADGGPIDPAWLDVLDARIAPRGPDGAGRFLGTAATAGDGTSPAQVALLHRRLSILDHEGGAQPMEWPPRSSRATDAPPDLVVVFNGCLYNHRALRAELESAGNQFFTDHSDTEVLLHGYRTWGEHLTARLEGMYAFVLWDRAHGALVMGRDWFGEKPLYVGRVDDISIVASDARAVALVQESITGTTHDTDPWWLRDALRFGVPTAGRTPYGGSAAMSAVTAHPIGLPYDIGEEDEYPTWRIDADADAFAIEVESTLRAAVHARLDADVPLGCFLSGGVDSSLIAHYAREAGPLKTFTVRMPDPSYDESTYAERVAAHLGTEHVTLPCDAQPGDDLEHLIDRLGQPFGDSSILPTYWVSRAARQVATVALGGDGGDELGFGYDRYRGAPVLTNWRAIWRLVPRTTGAAFDPRHRRHRLGRLARMARDWPHAGLHAMTSLFDARELDALLGSLRAADEPRFAREFDPDPGAALRRLDLRHYLPNDLLTKVDTASMACPIEVRSPFLDRALVRLMVGAHPTLVRRDRRKGLLRDIALAHLPRDIVERPKMGFSIPVGAWFRDPQHDLGMRIRDLLSSADPFGRLPIDAAAARQLLTDHDHGTARHDQRLFVLLTMAMWARTTG